MSYQIIGATEYTIGSSVNCPSGATTTIFSTTMIYGGKVKVSINLQLSSISPNTSTMATYPITFTTSKGHTLIGSLAYSSGDPTAYTFFTGVVEGDFTQGESFSISLTHSALAQITIASSSSKITFEKLYRGDSF